MLKNLELMSIDAAIATMERICDLDPESVRSADELTETLEGVAAAMTSLIFKYGNDTMVHPTFAENSIKGTPKVDLEIPIISLPTPEGILLALPERPWANDSKIIKRIRTGTNSLSTEVGIAVPSNVDHLTSAYAQDYRLDTCALYLPYSPNRISTISDFVGYSTVLRDSSLDLLTLLGIREATGEAFQQIPAMQEAI